VSVSGYTETVLVGSGLHSATGVAVDGSGNVYYCNSSSNSGDLGIQSVVRKTLSGGSYTDSTVADISTGLDNPIDVAVDASGNVYIVDTDIGKVWKETPSGGGYTQTTVGSGLNHPRGVAVDGRGNVYLADTGNLRVLKEAPSAGSYTQTTVTTALQFSVGIAVDGNGNLYIADYDKDKVLELNIVDPPILNFADTNVGSTSSDSPQTVTMSNIGNANLTFPVPATGNSPSISTGFTLGGSRRCNQQQRVSDLTPSGPYVVFNLRRKPIELRDAHRIVSRRGLRVCGATKAKQENCHEHSHGRRITENCMGAFVFLSVTLQLHSIPSCHHLARQCC
jgi:hypothetical protein